MSNSNATPRRVSIEPGIYRRRDGDLEIGWRDACGIQRWRHVHGGIRAARAALANAHSARARGERVAADPRLRFSDAAQAWWDARVREAAPGHAERLRSRARPSQAAEHFGRSRMTDITPQQVADYVSAQQDAGLKGWTIKGHLTVLSSVYSYSARHLGLVGINPVSLLDRVERPSTDDEKSKRILSADELARLLASVDDDYRLLFELAGETGGRLAEVLGLVWQDVDLDAETVTFACQLDRDGKRAAAQDEALAPMP